MSFLPVLHTAHIKLLFPSSAFLKGLLIPLIEIYSPFYFLFSNKQDYQIQRTQYRIQKAHARLRDPWLHIFWIPFPFNHGKFIFFMFHKKKSFSDAKSLGYISAFIQFTWEKIMTHNTLLLDFHNARRSMQLLVIFRWIVIHPKSYLLSSKKLTSFIFWSMEPVDPKISSLNWAPKVTSQVSGLQQHPKLNVLQHNTPPLPSKHH